MLLIDCLKRAYAKLTQSKVPAELPEVIDVRKSRVEPTKDSGVPVHKFEVIHETDVNVLSILNAAMKSESGMVMGEITRNRSDHLKITSIVDIKAMNRKTEITPENGSVNDARLSPANTYLDYCGRMSVDSMRVQKLEDKFPSSITHKEVAINDGERVTA